ncbi:hypothetical protein HNQ39_005934 [Armatimonas rosea]|uniref:Uncharacterized protein n=1 Tax=Armatimonas rosea TaxID=685828 RepID=A0A7W9SWE1_ARMRO|nr:hypothetical protein [Armatimonas rosea]
MEQIMDASTAKSYFFCDCFPGSASILFFANIVELSQRAPFLDIVEICTKDVFCKLCCSNFVIAQLTNSCWNAHQACHTRRSPATLPTDKAILAQRENGRTY